MIKIVLKSTCVNVGCKEIKFLWKLTYKKIAGKKMWKKKIRFCENIWKIQGIG